MNRSVELVIIPSIVFVEEWICLKLLTEVLLHHCLCFRVNACLCLLFFKLYLLSVNTRKQVIEEGFCVLHFFYLALLHLAYSRCYLPSKQHQKVTTFDSSQQFQDSFVSVQFSELKHFFLLEADRPEFYFVGIGRQHLEGRDRQGRPFRQYFLSELRGPLNRSMRFEDTIDGLNEACSLQLLIVINRAYFKYHQSFLIRQGSIPRKLLNELIITSLNRTCNLIGLQKESNSKVIRMILIQKYKIIEYESFDVDCTFGVVLVYNAIKFLDELDFSNAQLCDDLEEVTQGCDPFFFAFAELRVEGETDSVFLLVFQLVPEVIHYHFQQILCHQLQFLWEFFDIVRLEDFESAFDVMIERQQLENLSRVDRLVEIFQQFTVSKVFDVLIWKLAGDLIIEDKNKIGMYFSQQKIQYFLVRRSQQHREAFLLKPNIAFQVVDHDTADLANLIVLAKHSQTKIVHKWPLTLIFFCYQLVDKRHMMGHYLVEVQNWLIRVVIRALNDYLFEVFAIVHQKSQAFLQRYPECFGHYKQVKLQQVVTLLKWLIDRERRRIDVVPFLFNSDSAFHLRTKMLKKVLEDALDEFQRDCMRIDLFGKAYLFHDLCVSNSTSLIILQFQFELIWAILRTRISAQLAYPFVFRMSLSSWPMEQPFSRYS